MEIIMRFQNTISNPWLNGMLKHAKAKECESIAIMSMFGLKFEHIILYFMLGSSCYGHVSWHNIVLYWGWLKVLLTSFVCMCACVVSFVCISHTMNLIVCFRKLKEPSCNIWILRRSNIEFRLYNKSMWIDRYLHSSHWWLYSNL